MSTTPRVNNVFELNDIRLLSFISEFVKSNSVTRKLNPASTLLISDKLKAKKANTRPESSYPVNNKGWKVNPIGFRFTSIIHRINILKATYHSTRLKIFNMGKSIVVLLVELNIHKLPNPPITTGITKIIMVDIKLLSNTLLCNDSFA